MGLLQKLKSLCVQGHHQKSEKRDFPGGPEVRLRVSSAGGSIGWGSKAEIRSCIPWGIARRKRK